MNLDAFFSLIYSDDESNSSNEIKLEQKEQVLNENIIKILMFEKTFINTNYIFNLISNVLDNSHNIKQLGEDLPNNENIINRILYNRALLHIKFVDFEEEKTMKFFKNRDNTHILTHIDKSINYFKSSEEYRKCAVLHKLLIFLKK